MILESIGKINESIEKCSNMTFQTMVKKYEEIKNTFNSIDDINKKNETEFLIEYKEKIDGTNYVVKSLINNFVNISIFPWGTMLKLNKFILYFDEDTIKGRISQNYGILLNKLFFIKKIFYVINLYINFLIFHYYII